MLNTLDNEPPTVKQEFTHDGTDSGKLPTPYPDTSIRLVFSESVKGKTQDGTGKPVYNEFKKLYDEMLSAPAEKKEAAREALANALKAHIKLYYRPVSGQPTLVAEKTATSVGDWVIDYRYATVTLDADSGEMIVTFPYNKDNPTESAINLSSGVTYYFEFSGIVDTSVAENAMVGSRGVTKLPEFTTIDAQLVFSAVENSGQLPDAKGDPDMTFRISPVTASSVSDSILWDMVIWSDKTLSFEIYQRKVGATEWGKPLGTVDIPTTSDTPRIGVCLFGSLGQPPEQLKKFDADREYAIKVKSLEGSAVENDWSGKVALTLLPVSGTVEFLRNLSTVPLTPDAYKNFQNDIYAVKEIGVPREYTIFHTFRDQNPPTFSGGRPTFAVGDSSAKIEVLLNRPNTKYYYVVTKVGVIDTVLTDNTPITAAKGWEKLPQSGRELNEGDNGNVTAPLASDITGNKYLNNPSYIAGSGSYNGSIQHINLTGLEASTKYIAYFVLKGESPESTSNVYAFRFETAEVVRPILTINAFTTSAIIKADRDAKVSYVLFTNATSVPPYTEPLEKYLIENPDKSAYGRHWKPDYRKLTLLKAMSTPVEVSNAPIGSVFDLFAKQTIKETIANMVMSGQGGSNIVASGSLTLNASNNNTSKPIDFSKFMLLGNQYWIVAVGQSPLGSGYAFSANFPLYVTDTQPPRVSSISTAITAKTGNNAYPTYNGTVSISFDKDLYYLKDTKTCLQVVDKPVDSLVGQNGVISSALLVTCNPPTIKLVHQKTASTNALYFNFTGIRPESTITFKRELADANGNVGTSMGTLIITLKAVDANGNPQFMIASGSAQWDATGGSLTYDPKK